MDNDDDFTFCQVGNHIDQDQNEANKIVQDIGSITLKNELANVHAGNQSNGFVQKDEFPSNGTKKKEATFGSLSFTVMDASTSKQSSEISRQTSPENAVDPVKVNPEPSATAARKPTPRAKVPFEKGYSQMDWLKLTRTHPDLAGLKGQSNRRLIPMGEVKQHRTEGSMWTVLKGRVYNLSPYMKFHPGGDDILLKAVGKDCTSLFNKYHAWVNAEFLLEKCLVGTLDDSK